MLLSDVVIHHNDTGGEHGDTDEDNRNEIHGHSPERGLKRNSRLA
jgi:hypothetical protein